MRKTRTLAGLGILAVSLLALTACNSGTPGSPDAGSDGGSSDAPVYCAVVTEVAIENRHLQTAKADKTGHT